MIIKLLIISVVLVGGLVLIYPNEIIQFSTGTSIQDKTEKNFSDLKEDTFDNLREKIDQTFQKINNKIDSTINNLFT